MINDNLCRDHNHTQVLQEICFLLDIYIYICINILYVYMYLFKIIIYIFLHEKHEDDIAL